MSTQTQQNPSTLWAVLSHIGGLFTSVIAPLIIYLVTKNDPSEELASKNAMEALNFQITMLLVITILMVSVIGAFLAWIPMIFNGICCIMAAVKASNGQVWRYPLTLRLIK